MANVTTQFELLQKNMTTAIYDGIKNANSKLQNTMSKKSKGSNEVKRQFSALSAKEDDQDSKEATHDDPSASVKSPTERPTRKRRRGTIRGSPLLNVEIREMKIPDDIEARLKNKADVEDVKNLHVIKSNKIDTE